MFATLDFEASSLGSTGFPIEVGVTMVSTKGGTVSTWSTLIQPHPTWRIAAGWDRKSEGVHGIAQTALVDGMPPAAVLQRLNSLLAPLTCAWCDGGDYDRFWFHQLCKAAPLVRPAFELRDLSELSQSQGEREALTLQLARSKPEHRAGPDAERLARALMKVRLSHL